MYEDYIGEVDVNYFVVYAKGGDFSTLGTYKKDIWIVENTFRQNNDIYAEIKNISKDSKFKTLITNLLDVDVLRGRKEWQKYFSTRSLEAYRKYMGYNNYETEETYGWDKEVKVSPIHYKNTTGDVSTGSHKFDNGDEEPYTATGTFTFKTTGEVTMMNKLINDNMDAAKTGAVLSAGNTLNKVVKDTVRGQVPHKYRKLLDTPMADIVIANVANVAVQNFSKTNRKANVATQAMMEAAMVQFMNSFNLDQIISDTLKNVNLDELLDTSV